MILYSNAFALAEPTPARTRIGWDTYTRSLNLTSAAITVSGETAEGPRDAPLRPETSEYWLAPAMPATWKIDLGAAKDLDYVGIAGHQIGSLGASALVETSTNDSVYTTLGTAVAPADNQALLFLDVLRTARYIRVTLTGATPPRVAVVYAGVLLSMPKYPIGPFTPINLARKTELWNGMSEGGQFLGQGFWRNGAESSINFMDLDGVWVRSNFNNFAKAARQYPYFIAWNPVGYPLEVGYVWTTQDIVPRYSGRVDYMDVGWPMVGQGAE